MFVPLKDLSRISKPIQQEIDEALIRVNHSGHFLFGNYLKAFEKEFAAYCGTEFAFGVGNGTDALEIALKALGIKSDDQVVTVANAGGYSTISILNSGARPVFVDVDKDSMNMSIESLEEVLSPSISAIIVTHLYGQLANIEAISLLAKSYKIPVIEDCSQAHGATRDNKKAGSFGDIGVFSFYPTKNLGAHGDAGALITSNPKLATRIKQLSQYGWQDKYHVHLHGGRNSRMDEFQAAVLQVKLKYLDHNNASLVSTAKQYHKALCHTENITLPSIPKEGYVAHLFVIRTPCRDALQQHLSEKDIQTQVHFPVPDHLQQGWKPLMLSTPVLLATEELC